VEKYGTLLLLVIIYLIEETRSSIFDLAMVVS